MFKYYSKTNQLKQEEAMVAKHIPDNSFVYFFNTMANDTNSALEVKNIDKYKTNEDLKANPQSNKEYILKNNYFVSLFGNDLNIKDICFQPINIFLLTIDFNQYNIVLYMDDSVRQITELFHKNSFPAKIKLNSENSFLNILKVEKKPEHLFETTEDEKILLHKLIKIKGFRSSVFNYFLFLYFIEKYEGLFRFLYVDETEISTQDIKKIMERKIIKEIFESLY